MAQTPIYGIVLSPEGDPSRGASVTTATDRCGKQMPPFVTDALGRFECAATPGEIVTITVTAPNCAPELVQFVMGDDLKNVKIVLSKAATIRGRVVGTDGEAVPGALVYANSWRGCHSLWAHVQCDAKGVFVWDQAPRDVVYFDIDGSERGYVRASSVPLIAGEETQTITVRKRVEFFGTVVDAETDEPIDRYMIMPGVSHGDRQSMFWHTSLFREGTGGAFSFVEDPRSGRTVTAVRITAEGYIPETSALIIPQQQRVDLQFRLRRAEDLTVVVLTPGGRAAVGARALLATPGQPINLQNCDQVSDHGCPESIADASGRITLPPQKGPFKLLVFSDDGYLLIDHDSLPKQDHLTLESWAKVEGVLIVNGQPSADQRVMASVKCEPPRDHRPRVHHSLETKTDANGRFGFDRIPPGEVTFARTILRTMPGGRTTGHWVERKIVELAPGEQAQIQIGGTGRTVIGKLLIPPELIDVTPHWITGIDPRFHTKYSGPPFPKMPDDIRNGTEEQQREWSRAFSSSEAGVAFRAGRKKDQESRQYFGVQVEPDGSFRVEDVAAGVYELKVFIRRPAGGDPHAHIAVADAEIAIPEMSDNRCDVPLLVPDIVMKMT